MDWKDSLSQYLTDHPELPDGDNATEQQLQHKQPLPRLEIILDRKGRKGKSATIVSGFSADDNETLQHVASILKRELGVGGSARGGEILIQGDRRREVASRLGDMGYKTQII